MVRRSYLVVPLLAVLAVVGVGLVVTAGDDGTNVDRVVTAEGVVVDVPTGWVVSSDFDFQYVPPPDLDNGLDIWSVAWACPPDDCDARSLDDWLTLAPDLPTFISAREEAGATLFDIEESSDERSWLLSARTDNDLHIVNMAVFRDGAGRYLACNLAVLGDPGGLDEGIVDACLSAEVPA